MRYYRECVKCGKEIAKRYSKVQESISDNSKHGYTALCSDCSKQ